MDGPTASSTPMSRTVGRLVTGRHSRKGLRCEAGLAGHWKASAPGGDAPWAGSEPTDDLSVLWLPGPCTRQQDTEAGPQPLQKDAHTWPNSGQPRERPGTRLESGPQLLSPPDSLRPRLSSLSLWTGSCGRRKFGDLELEWGSFKFHFKFFQINAHRFLKSNTQGL